MSQAQKLLGGCMLLAAPFVAYFSATSFGWATIQLNCQPKGGQTQCQLSENTKPGKKTTTATIAKSQITGVKVLERRGNKQGIVNQIVLTTIDKGEIPLTKNWGGSATVQLLKHTDEIETFIADPQAQNLDIQTDRDYLSMVPGLLIGASLAWQGLQALLSDDD
jgi:hypothetical protein